jgi:branched-chain amino acid aminotransferase
MAETRSQGSAWVDGVVMPLAEARIPVTDRGFLFADSVFDSVRTYGGAPFLLGDHLDRLRRSAAALSMPVPWSDAQLTAIVGATLEGSELSGEASLRVIVTRGDGCSGLLFPEPQVPRLVVLCRPTPPSYEGLFEAGVELVRPTEHRGKGGLMGHVKSGDYLGNVLALNEGRRAGGMEALMRGADGSWSEATTSNLFSVRDGVVSTPGPEAGILPGVTRATLLAVLAAAGVPLAQRSLFDVDLDGADELFITSSLKEVLPAVRLDGRIVGDGTPGSLTRTVQGLFRDAVARLMAGGHQRLSELFPA